MLSWTKHTEVNSLKLNKDEKEECIEHLKERKVISSHTKRLMMQQGYDKNQLEEDICKNLEK